MPNADCFAKNPPGHFSQAPMIEARGRLVFISGMTARRTDGTIATRGFRSPVSSVARIRRRTALIDEFNESNDAIDVAP
jgi:hypothetical protein